MRSRQESRNTLSPRQAQALEALDRCGTLAKAATELGIKYGTIRTLVYNGRAKLKRQALISEQERIKAEAERSFIERYGTGDLHEARRAMGHKARGDGRSER